MINLRPPDGLRLVLQFFDHDDGLVVQIVDSPVGSSAPVATHLPPIEDVLRRAPASYEDVGRALFRALFPGDLADRMLAAVSQATLDGRRLALELRFAPDAARAARYPWELLHDGTHFLMEAGVSVTRTLPYPAPNRPLPARVDPLEVLMIAAHPSDLAPLEPTYDALLGTLADGPQLDLAYLLPPTWDALLDWLLAGPPGVLHFEGHGAVTPTGRLVFETAAGASDPVDAEVLGSVFHSAALPLMVLSASAPEEAAESLLGSVAPSLILAGIPAVVAMQAPLPVEAARRFMGAFYEALLAGKPLEEAVADGRQPLARTRYWPMPTLYRRTVAVGAHSQEVLAWRVDTAAPQHARPGYPLRAALWLRAPSAPPLPDETIARIIGFEPGPAPAAAFPVSDAPLTLAAGPVEIRLEAPGCEIHGPTRHVIWLAPEHEPPPVWFVLTPRGGGEVTLSFGLWQANVRVGTVAHALHTSDGSLGPPVAPVIAHGAPHVARPVPPARPLDRPDFPLAAPSADTIGPSALVAVSQPSPLDDATVSEALDEALAWAKRPETAPPADEDSAPEPDPPASSAREGRRWLLLIGLVVGVASIVTAALVLVS